MVGVKNEDCYPKISETHKNVLLFLIIVMYEWYNYSMIIMNKIIRLQSTNNVLDAKI